MTETAVYTQKEDFLQHKSGLVPLSPNQKVPCRNFVPNLFPAAPSFTSHCASRSGSFMQSVLVLLCPALPAK